MLISYMLRNVTVDKNGKGLMQNMFCAYKLFLQFDLAYRLAFSHSNTSAYNKIIGIVVT